MYVKISFAGDGNQQQETTESGRQDVNCEAAGYRLRRQLTDHQPRWLDRVVESPRRSRASSPRLGPRGEAVRLQDAGSLRSHTPDTRRILHIDLISLLPLPHHFQRSHWDKAWRSGSLEGWRGRRSESRCRSLGSVCQVGILDSSLAFSSASAQPLCAKGVHVRETVSSPPPPPPRWRWSAKTPQRRGAISLGSMLLDGERCQARVFCTTHAGGWNGMAELC